MKLLIKLWLIQIFISVGCTPDFQDVRHTVIEVINGNTLVLKSGHLIKLVGIGGTEATQVELEKVILNQRIMITFDKTNYPEDFIPGELMFGYVSTLDGASVNGHLLRQKLTNLDHAYLSDSLRSFESYIVAGYPRPNKGSTTSLIVNEVAPRKSVNSLSVLYEHLKPAVFMVLTETKQGSGFFISAGVGVSNYHVIDGDPVEDISIATHDGGQFTVSEVLAYSKEKDYIIFRVETGSSLFPYLDLSLDEPKVGEEVFAIGNPQGLEHTLSKGIVSSYREGRELIQTNTEITHGSSGGPLLNMQGEVVGITASGLGEANLNFAINISLLKRHF